MIGTAMLHTPCHIAIFVEDLKGGGAEKIAVTLANALAARGIKVDLIMQRAVGHFLAEIAPGVQKFDIGMTDSRNPLPALIFLTGYLRSHNPDVLLAHMEKPSLLAITAGLITGYKKIIPCVHTDLATYAKLEHRIRRTILKHLVGFFYRFVNRIIAVSAGTSASTRALIGAQAPPIHIVYNGFDLAGLQRRATEPPECGVPWFKDKDTPVIIACGRLVEQKGFDVLLQAFALLRAKTPARLVILGEGPMRGDLMRLAHILKIETDVAMPGFVSNPAACFVRSDLFVLSSRVEGLSNVLIEAMMTGIPVVCTDCPTGPREVLQGGKFGRLVPVDDVAALAEAMRAALLSKNTNPARDSAYRENLEIFSVGNMVAGYLDVARQAAALTLYTASTQKPA